MSAELRERVKRLNLKQYWIADQVGIHKTSLRRWLRGETRTLKPENQKKLEELVAKEEVLQS